MGTHLNNVGFHLDLLRGEVPLESADGVRERLTRIDAEMAAIRTTLRQLRESTTTLPVRLGEMPEPIAPVLEVLASVFGEKCRPRGIDFVLNAAPRGERLLAKYDRDWLTYALQCLLTNSIEAIEAYATGAYPARQGGHRITLEAKSEDGYVFIAVADSGVGFSPEARRRLFLPLYTTKEKTRRSTRPVSSTVPEEAAEVPDGCASSAAPARVWGDDYDRGTGLFTVRRVLAAHGGTISPHSDGLGKGARFEIRLPTDLPPDTERESSQTGGDDSDAETEDASEA
jgi:signal transduction histidine kinase